MAADQEREAVEILLRMEAKLDRILGLENADAAADAARGRAGTRAGEALDQKAKDQH